MGKCILTRRIAASSVCARRAPLTTRAHRGESSMYTSRLAGAAVLGTLCLLISAFAPAAAEPAALASGLRELAAAYDSGDPRLSAQLAIHITNHAGDPLVLVHLKPGADANA